MDLVRTILLYLMMIVGTATGTSPQVTPVPASQVATPAPYVTATPDPQSLITAAPTAAPTQAVYRTLILNDKGTDVRRLQRRLAELGYLTTADVDGQYGSKTKRAVEQFQRKNGLRVDGIAGTQTQQVMFESPNVIYYNSATLTPVPTQTPIPYVSVPVYYVDASTGAYLSSGVYSCFGTTNIYADSSKVPSGYTLVSNSPVQVIVRNGVATPSSVTFRYQGPVTQVTIPVYYQTAAGATVAQGSAVLSRSGYVYADSSLVPGYVFTSSTSRYVTVTGGQASVSAVVFQVALSATATPRPTERPRAVVAVQYLDAVTGRLLYQTTVTMYQSGYVFARDNQVPAGYTRTGAQSQYVTVTNGAASPSAVQFYYTNPSVTATPAPSVTVPVYYVDAADSRILVRGSVQLTRSSYVYYDQGLIPAGYSLAGDRYVYVTLNGGTANPANVVFRIARTATPTPVPSVQVPVRYMYGSTTIYNTTVSCPVGGSTVVVADPSVYSPAYVLSSSSPSRQTVTVSADGRISPTRVTFYLTRPAPTETPLTYVDVEVRYMYGSQVVALDYETLRVGRTTTVIAETSAFPNIYQLSGSTRVNVTVSSTGVVSPTAVVFNLTLKATATPTAAPQTQVRVPVRYVYGSQVVASTYVYCYSGRTTAIYADPERYDTRRYVISGSDVVYVTVSANGQANPSTVTFSLAARATATPTKPPRRLVDVPVSYMYGDTQIAFEYVQCYTGETSTVYADENAYPSAYVLSGSNYVQVYVDDSGMVTPGIVTFYLTRRATQAPTATPYTPTQVPVARVNVPVIYMCNGEVVTQYETVCTSEQTNVVYADAAVYGNIYQLDGPDRQTVQVSYQGIATPSEVIFYLTYRTTPEPTAVPSFRVDVPVQYMSGRNLVYETFARCMNDGVTEVTADPSVYAGSYELAGPSSVSVRVTVDGVASPSIVTFQLTPIQPEPEPEPEPQPQPEPEPQPQPAPSGQTLRTLLPQAVNAYMAGDSMTVYLGPGEEYALLGADMRPNQKMPVSVYGAEGDWLAIGFFQSDMSFCFGYVRSNQIDMGRNTPKQINYDYSVQTLGGKVQVTTDPATSNNKFKAYDTLNAGTQVTLLCWFDSKKNFALVEYYSSSGQPVRAFIRSKDL